MKDKSFYTKSVQLTHWNKLKANSNILGTITPIPNGVTGSTYGACGIRICGNPEFVDAVMGRLKDLIDCENGQTRLTLARSVVKDTEINGTKKQFDFAGMECVYIQCHERGNEAIGVEAREGSTNRWLDANPKRRAAYNQAVEAFNRMVGRTK